MNSVYGIIKDRYKNKIKIQETIDEALEIIQLRAEELIDNMK